MAGDILTPPACPGLRTTVRCGESFGNKPDSAMLLSGLCNGESFILETAKHVPIWEVCLGCKGVEILALSSTQSTHEKAHKHNVRN